MTKSRRGLAMFSSRRTKKKSYNVEENMLQNKPQTMLESLRSVKLFLASELKAEKLSAGAEKSRVESVQLIERVIEEVLERKLLLKDEQNSSLQGSPEPEISNEDATYENVNSGYCSEKETTEEPEENVDEDWSTGYIDMATINTNRREEGYLDMSTMRRKDRPFIASTVAKRRSVSFPNLLSKDTKTTSEEQDKKALTFSKSVDVKRQRPNEYEDIDDFYMDVVAPDEDTVVKHLKQLKNFSSVRVRQNAVYSGYLMKKKRKFLGSKWEKVYAVIRNNVMVLFKSEEDETSTGVIILNGYNICAAEKQGKPGFQLVPTSFLTATPRPIHRFRCEEAVLDKWLKSVKSLEHRTLSEKQKEAFLQAAHLFDESDDEVSTDDVRNSGVVASDDYININSEELTEKLRTLPNISNEEDLYECPQYPDQGETTYTKITDDEQSKKSQTLPKIRNTTEIYECPQHEDQGETDYVKIIDDQQSKKSQTLPNIRNMIEIYESPQHEDKGETDYVKLIDDEQSKKSRALPNIRNMIEIYEFPQYEDQGNDESASLIYENVPQETVSRLSKEVPKPVAKTK